MKTNATFRQALFVCSLLLAVSGLVYTQNQPKPAADNGVTAIRNAKIVTVTGETIQRGTVLIKDGKIAAIGATVAIPAGAKQIDATGLSVYPGMIDTYTQVGLTEVGQGAPGTVDTTELGDFNSNMKALTAVNPNSELIPVARMNGVTTVLTCPQGGMISGQCAFINLDGWTPQEMKLVAPGAMHVVYPAGGGRGPWWFWRRLQLGGAGQAQQARAAHRTTEQEVRRPRKNI
jgi:hypothetical protein